MKPLFPTRLEGTHESGKAVSRASRQFFGESHQHIGGRRAISEPKLLVHEEVVVVKMATNHV